MNKVVQQIKNQIKQGDWTGYVTYYPHKKAYRPIEKLDLENAWKDVTKLNLYVHIPFCTHKCTYCNLFSTVMDPKTQMQVYTDYVEKVLEEIKYNAQFVNKKAKIMTVYFGGGTPNILSAEQLSTILNCLKLNYPNWDSNIEVCTECSPDLITLQYLQTLKAAGFARISVGVQSLNENEIKTINRHSNFEMIKNIRMWAKQVGLHINFDLIYGLPYQTPASFFDSLNKIISLSPESICTYPLAIKKHTAINEMDKDIMLSMKQKYKLFAKIRSHLEKNGYHIETIVRFVKNEQSSPSTCQMEKYEYEGISTLGFGCGARSYSPVVNYCVTYKVIDKFIKDIINQYLSTPAPERKFTGYFYEQFDLNRKFVMLNLLDAGVSIPVYEYLFNSNLLLDFGEQFKALKKLKLIWFNKTTQAFRLTRKGMQYCDLVANCFVSSNVQKLYDTYVEQ